jgi:hypothetical protein
MRVGIRFEGIRKSARGAALLATLLAASVEPARAADANGAGDFRRDRGEGMPTSLFGTWIDPGEVLVYPFHEYTRRTHYDYKPADLGYEGTTDYAGRFTEREWLLFAAWRFDPAWAIEFESALHTSIDFRKSPEDASAVPERVRESGLGDTEAQMRWRAMVETASSPELTAYFKTVFPLQRNAKLRGTQHWEFGPGLAATKGLSFGTVQARLSATYETGEKKLKLGEYAIDYYRRLSTDWRLALSLEGLDDEVDAIGELQYVLARNALLKLNFAYGVTNKARGIAPEIGVMFRF